MDSPPNAKPITGSFDENIFQARYQRNNKRGGLKNLRCFPTCASQHKERGFCGRSIVTQIKTDHPERLLCWAEFLKNDEPRPRAFGHSITLQEAESLSRSKSEPLKPWIKGRFVPSHSSDGKHVFEFNHEKRGWHYGWASNKHTCNSDHILVVWIFEPTPFDPEVLRVRGVVESPPFMLFCRRRRRFTLVPSAPFSEPSSSKRLSSGQSKILETNQEEEEDEDDEEEFFLEKPLPVEEDERVVSRKHVKLDALDKNRVDALLSLLHLAWRKIKDDPPFQTTMTPKDALQEGDFFEMLDFLVGEDDFEKLLQEENNFLLSTTTLASSFPPLPCNSPGGHVSEVEEWVNSDVDALARYLLDAQDFRQSIAWLRGHHGASPDFSAFLGVLRDHIQLFMRQKKWDIGDLDRMINQPQKVPTLTEEVSTPLWMLDGGDRFSWNFATSSTATTHSLPLMPTSPRHFFISNGNIRVPNIQGVWKQTVESKAAMERVRERTGSSWVMSKLFEFMESKFTIHQSGLDMSCRLWPMPALKFVLDGEERPWGIRLPLFQPDWTYRAWTDGDVIMLQHQIENRRLTRKYWCDEARQYLYSEAILEIYDMHMRKFQEESRIVQVANRSVS